MGTMSAVRAGKSGLWVRWFGRKPTKPDARANRLAFKVGAKQSKNGSTPGLQEVVRLALENEARLHR
jgi:hypothetical protein